MQGKTSASEFLRQHLPSERTPCRCCLHRCSSLWPTPSNRPPLVFGSRSVPPSLSAPSPIRSAEAGGCQGIPGAEVGLHQVERQATGRGNPWDLGIWARKETGRPGVAANDRWKTGTSGVEEGLPRGLEIVISISKRMLHAPNFESNPK